MTTTEAPRTSARTVRPGRHIAQSNTLSRASAMLVMGVFTVYFLLPVWWLLVSATKTRGQLTSTAALWFTPDGFANLLTNLRQLFTYDGNVFVHWIVNSIVYAGAGAFLGTLIAAMCGYALAKYSFRGREGLFNLILGGVLVPSTALALPLFLIFSRIQLTNTYWAVFLPSIVNPFGVYLARIFAAASVPDELLEAARLDGAGEVRTFFTVSLRLMSPALVTIFLFQFVAIWNNFFLPLIMLRDQKLFPLTLGLYSWNSAIGQAPELRTLVIIGALVSILPLIIAFLSLQRFWSSGLSAGSVK